MVIMSWENFSSIHYDSRSGPTVAEAFIKEGKAASKAAASGKEY